MSKEAILEKIREYQKIMLFRHVRVDGDCVGATKGLKEILRLSYPDKEIYLIDNEHSEYLAFLGPDDPDVPDEVYREALGIVIDTASVKRISNPKYALCKELIKLDHHINIEPYGDVSWVEDWRSSACEMIAAFYDAFRGELKINKDAATYIYTGMVTDSGRFRYEGVNGDTMRMAGLMLDQGIDLETLYSQLTLKDFESLRLKAHVYEHMDVTAHGVASIYIGLETQRRFDISFEEACSAISWLEGIKGCLCWLAFIECEDGSIRVRLRSRFMTVNELAEKYNGGGHACASGATVYSQEEAQALLQDADDSIKEYKETHEGWL